MLATPGRPPDDPRGWAVEMKYDGMRVIAACRRGRWRLFSRTLAEITAVFPDVADGLAALVGTDGMILDGELVAPTPGSGAPSFRRLQRRMGRTRPSGEVLSAVPVQVFVFDLLHTGAEPTTSLRYRTRRALLDELSLSGPGVLTPPSWTGVAARQLLEVAADHHLEGIVSKHLESVYRPSVRSRHWIKTVLRQVADVVVAGYIPAAGPSGRIGSLVLSAHDATGALVGLGHVGTGFTDAERRALHNELDRIRIPRSPLHGERSDSRSSGSVCWVAPTVVGSVQYRELTDRGLRHPSWRGLRPDIPASEVAWPS